MIGAAEHRKQFVCIATHSMRQISCESGVTSEEVSVMGMEQRTEQIYQLLKWHLILTCENKDNE